MEKKNTPQEEIDLGKLFTLIGNGFKNMFNGILNIFKTIFHYIILIIIFFKNHTVKFVIAAVIGGVIGYFLDTKKTPKYKSSMIVETNFGSGHRLYNQIDYINSLIAKKDTITIAEIFDLPSNKVSKLRRFIIKPYEPEKNLKLEYDYYLKHTDTIYTFSRDFSIKDFEERMSNPDYRLQEIKVISKDFSFLPKMKEGIISLVNNKYYRKRYDIKNIELQNRKLILEKDLKQIDSLRVLYKNVALLTAKKQNTPSTSIDLSAKGEQRNVDLDLFKERASILGQLKRLNTEIIRSNFVINVVSNFNKGEKIDSISKQSWFLGAALFFILTLAAILVLKINKYLLNYENKNN